MYIPVLNIKKCMEIKRQDLNQTFLFIKHFVMLAHVKDHYYNPA